MSKRPGPDDPGAPATGSSGSPPEPDKLTSDDIFGDILEEVGGKRLGAEQPAAKNGARRPIKVQVSEPLKPGGRPVVGPAERPSAPALRRRPVKELLPEDVEALLDVISHATETQEEPAAPDEAPEMLVELEPEPLPVEAEPLPVEAEALLELEGEQPPPWMDAAELGDAATAGETVPEAAEEEHLPPPPPVARHLKDDTDEGRRDLMALMRMPKGRAHRMADGPNKFTAAAPGGGAAASDLDLAAVAERALYEAEAEAEASAPGNEPTPLPGGEIRYGPYRLLRRIAVGGMAEVFRGKRTGVEGFEKVVAVKRILPHLSDNKEFVDMFIDEAKMVAGLTHPNIVQIFDLGRIDRTYFIAMEYVHGRDLRTIMRRAREKGLRVPLDLGLLVVSRVCSALEFAHRKKDERGVPMQIVHRDVSPQNILISFEGEVKLTDFGIAKAATKASITDAGALRGKLLYMSPEQAWGKTMDRRSDVFSLGVVFYEMVTDQKPFAASSEMSILETVRECRVVPPSQVNARVPEKLERVVMKALARDVDERYQDASEMYRDLERVLHERQPPTSVELSRFMEVLFEDAERSEVAGAPSAADLETPAVSEVHEDFGPPAAGESSPGEPAPARAPREPMSIQKLLKRFGIK
jgi:serine/threonine protein kinase